MSSANTREQKYALLGPNKFLEKKVYGVPWYQERVVERLRRQESAMARKTRQKLPVSKLADTSRWIFIKDGLDDFRDGLPPVVNDIFIRRKDAFPMVKPDHQQLLQSLKQTVGKHRFTKEEVCFSRTIPLVRRRRENVEDVEQGLLAHKLALFPHLMEAVPQDILEDVVQILDPEAAACIEVEEDDGAEENYPSRARTADTADDEEGVQHDDILTPLGGFASEKRRQIASAASTESAYTPISTAQDKPSPPSSTSLPQRPISSKNPYRWMYNRANNGGNLSPRIDGSLSSQRAQKQAEAAASVVTVDKFRPPAEGADGGGSNGGGALDGDGERHVTQVTKTFCDWVRCLGGEESNNIEESTILSLFAAGYETKPSLLVPIKVVELQNIPNELRVAAGVPPPPPPEKLNRKPGKRLPVDPNSIKTISEVEELKEEERRLRSRANPEFGKFTYGAWYLPKKYWEKRDADLSLEDPRDVHRRKETDTVRRNIAIEDQLASLTGSQSFVEFLQKKPRKPEFMGRVEKIMEQKKLEGETASVAGDIRNSPTHQIGSVTPGVHEAR